MVNTFTYYDRDPVPFGFVMRNAKADPLDRPDTKRLWVFVRDGIGEITDPVMQRIAARYRRQETFHAYDMTLYLYTRQLPAGAAPETGSEITRTDAGGVGR